MFRKKNLFIYTKLFLVFTLIFSLLYLTACTNSSEDASNSERTTLTVGHSGTLCQAAVILAAEKGFFDAEGIDVNFLQGDFPTLRDGLATGRVDVTYGLLMAWAKPIYNGLDLVFTGGVHTGCLAAVSNIDSNINSFADLPSRTIGVSAGIGGVPMNWAYRAIYKEGLDPNDFQWKNFNAPELIIALQRGEIDLAVTYDQVAIQWVEANEGELFLSSTYDEQFSNEYCCAVTFQGDYARNNPEVTARATRAILYAAAWLEDNKSEAVSLLMDNGYIAGDYEYNLGLLDSYNYIPSIVGGKEALREIAVEYVQTGLFSADTDVDKFVSDHYLELPELTDIDSYSFINGINAPNPTTNNFTVNAISDSNATSSTSKNGNFQFISSSNSCESK